MLRFLREREKATSNHNTMYYSILLKKDFGQTAMDAFDESKHSIQQYYELLFKQAMKKMQAEAETYLDAMSLFGNMYPAMAISMKDFHVKITKFFEGQHEYLEEVRTIYKNILMKIDSLNYLFTAIRDHDIATVYAVTAILQAHKLSENILTQLGKILVIAAQEGHTDSVRALLAAGANPNSVMQETKTPLIVATWYHHTETVGVLLEAGANPLFKDQDGQTPYDFAQMAGFTDILQTLNQDSEKLPDVFLRCTIS